MSLKDIILFDHVQEWLNKLGELTHQKVNEKVFDEEFTTTEHHECVAIDGEVGASWEVSDEYYSTIDVQYRNNHGKVIEEEEYVEKTPEEMSLSITLKLYELSSWKKHGAFYYPEFMINSLEGDE